jgi:nucleotidyltransferase substrate binding protein (TIGR01987 family)
MPLDVSSLRDALAALQTSLGYLASDIAKDQGMRDQFRGAAIQAFEFTYELAVKFLRRQLEQMAATPASVDEMTFMQVIRSAAEAGLVRDVARFRTYRETRNITSHAYAKDKAEAVLGVLPAFVDDVAVLLAELERRNRAAD